MSRNSKSYQGNFEQFEGLLMIETQEGHKYNAKKDDGSNDKNGGS